MMEEGIAKKEMARRTGSSMPTVRKYLNMIEGNQIFEFGRGRNFGYHGGEMKILDWVAILGALAWVPHLIKFVRDLFTRPSIRLYTQKRLTVGFTTLGPIIYLKTAFVVKNKDLVVSGMRFRLKHQDGDEKVFVWQEIVQTIGTHTYPAVSVPFQKQSDVLAIKAKESEVEDRFITFQDELFVDRWQDLGEKAMEKRMHLRRQGKTDEEFLMSVEMSELRTFNERSFSWKEGKYVLHFELDSPQKFRLSGNSYRFSLSSVDIEELERNKDLIQEAYRQSVIPKGEDDQEIVWNWRVPELREAT